MEQKEIFSVIAACCAVCLLIFVFGSIKGSDTPDGEESSVVASEPVVIPASSTNYWDKLHAQQTVPSETTAPAENSAPSESGEPKPENTEASVTTEPQTVTTSAAASTSAGSPSYSISYSGS